jgi:hypothetical protein
MKGITIVGVILVVLGLAGLLWPVISYTRTEKVAEIGPLEVTNEHTKTVPVPPLASGAAVAAGVALVIVGSRRRA